MQDITVSLEGLDSEARNRVLTYIFNRLGISFGGATTQTTHSSEERIPTNQTTDLETLSSAGISRAQQDIRSLKDEKNPATAVEMAVLVAYYLEEFAPQNEKKAEIGTNDITTYFKQAGYPLPKFPKMTLVHGKNSGYFESVERGLFKLNPVGYNLAAYTMGKEGSGVRPTRKKKIAKKSNTPKKASVKTTKKVGKK